MSQTGALAALERLNDAEKGMVILACDQEFAVTSLQDGDIEIEGWFITENLVKDRKIIVKSSAFRAPSNRSLFNGRILGFHDQLAPPVGVVIGSIEEVEGQGWRGSARIWRENPELLKRAIKEKVLRAFSIGFTIDKYEYDEKTDILTVTAGTLKEISLVNIGADSHAVFKVRQALTEATKQEQFTIIERSTALSAENKNLTVEQVMSANESLGVKVADLQKIMDGIKESQQAYADKIITKSDVAERFEKFSAELSVIKAQVEEAKTARAVAEHRLAYTDYRSLITDFVWLTDENGNKLGALAQRAYCLFQMPVDYDKMEYGPELKNLRDLYDATLLADAMARFKGRDRHSIYNLKLFKQLVKATEKFDKDISLAMAGGNVAAGAEWLPTELSSEFAEILRTTPRLASKFDLWNMPKGGSAKFPFQNGKAIVYRGSEPLVDNAEEARKTNVATGVKTFTPDLFIGSLVASEEITEDAILDMVMFIRKELATALLEGLESALINGDDSTTHFDNAVDTVYQSYNVERSFKGLRKLAVGYTRNIETSAGVTGPNSLRLINFTDMKQDMGIAGLNPAECVYVTGIKGRSLVQNALFQANAYGVLAFMITGQLPTIDGSEVYISGQYDEQLGSSGLRNSGEDVKHTSMVCAHKPSVRIGQRRGVTLEYTKNISTQQHTFVATARWDFGKICADAIVPVAAGINMQHTA